MATNNSWNTPALTANGQLLIGSTGANPAATTLTAGFNMVITNGPGTIQLDTIGSAAFQWNVVTGTAQAISVFNGYIANNAGLVTLTLPATANAGQWFRVTGLGAGGWKIAQNAGQTIHLGSLATTVGAGGSLASTNQYDGIEVLCVVANTTWVVPGGPQGNITVV